MMAKREKRMTVAWEPRVFKPLKAMDALPVEVDLVSALQRINSLVCSTADLDALLQGACEEIGRILQVDRVHLALKTGRGKVFGRIDYEWLSTDSILKTKGAELPSERYDEVVMDLVATPPPLAVLDPLGNPRLPAGSRAIYEAMQVQSAMAGRLEYQQKILGVLCVHQCDHVRQWTQQEATFLSVVLSQLSIAVANARMITTLQAQHEELVSLHFRLEESHAALERQVTTRTEELQEANAELTRMVDELKALDQMKTNFLDTVSHELRTPINFITGFGSLLADGVYGELTPEGCQAVEKVLDGADRLLHLVDDLLDQTRLQRGELSVNPVWFDYRELLCQVSDVMGPAMKERGQTLELAMPKKTPQLYADPARIHQILRNLLSNASKFTPEGGTVRIAIKATRDAVITEVSDTGIGIPPEALGRVFDRFYQVDNTRTRNYGGTGLGLAIVKGLLESMGGHIEVKSELGQGSTFRFALPLAVSTPVPQEVHS